MRNEQNEKLIAKNQTRQSELDVANLSLKNDVAFFEEKLNQLKTVLAGLEIATDTDLAELKRKREALQAEFVAAEAALMATEAAAKTKAIKSPAEKKPVSRAHQSLANKPSSSSDLDGDFIPEVHEHKSPAFIAYAAASKKLSDVDAELAAKISQADYQKLDAEKESVAQLVDTVSESLTVAKSTKKYGKMSDVDIDALQCQAAVIKNTRKLLDNPNDPERSLSQLIADAASCEYRISSKIVWLRRAKLILTGLLSGAAAIVIIAALMTPGVNILVTLPLILKTLHAMAAYLFLCKPATTSMSLFGVSIPVAIPSTMGSFASGFLGVKVAKKKNITTQPREVAARNVELAALQKLVDAVKNKLNDSNNNMTTEVKTFLLTVVDEAMVMLRRGASSRFHESIVSRMQKGRLILQTTAKIVEAGNIPETVSDLLKIVVRNNATYGQVLNAQRNPSLFGNRLSTFAKHVAKATANGNVFAHPVVRLASIN